MAVTEVSFSEGQEMISRLFNCAVALDEARGVAVQLLGDAQEKDLSPFLEQHAHGDRLSPQLIKCAETLGETIRCLSDTAETLRSLLARLEEYSRIISQE